MPWLVHGFSTRQGGVSEAYGGRTLNLGITPEDTREAVAQNRWLFFQQMGAISPSGEVWPSVSMRQIHSSVIHRVENTHICQSRADVGHQQSHKVLVGDGLITNVSGIVLSVRVADCLPVLIADPARCAVGAFHAGWRGTLERMVEKGVGEFRWQFGSNPAELVAAIGPSIHRCCYQVSEELRDKFASQFSYAEALFEDVSSSDPVRRKYPLLFMNMRAPGHGEPSHTVHLDLVEANRRQLLDSGVWEENIWISELCTACRADLFFSHRKERGVTGRMVGAIGITN
jgi:YfiH family protein